MRRHGCVGVGTRGRAISSTATVRPATTKLLRKAKVATQRRLAKHGIVAEIHRQGVADYFTFVEASGRHYPVDFPDAWIRTIEAVAPFTLTPPERVAAVCAATEYVVKQGVPGAFAECGVWRGGSMMAAALTLRRLGIEDRELFLFDTFDGATDPSAVDVNYRGRAIIEDWPPPPTDRADAIPKVEVEAALASTGYDRSRIHCVAGDVRETLPASAPSQLALLRLDTDFYDSTHHGARAPLSTPVSGGCAPDRRLRPLEGLTPSGRRVLRAPSHLPQSRRLLRSAGDQREPSPAALERPNAARAPASWRRRRATCGLAQWRDVEAVQEAHLGPTSRTGRGRSAWWRSGRTIREIARASARSPKTAAKWLCLRALTQRTPDSAAGADPRVLRDPRRDDLRIPPR